MVGESDCAKGTVALSVYLTPPAYNGSSLEQPSAEGKIVGYTVIVTPTQGKRFYFEDQGVVENNLVRRCWWAQDEL